jgi:hypothetical protein
MHEMHEKVVLRATEKRRIPERKIALPLQSPIFKKNRLKNS